MNCYRFASVAMFSLLALSAAAIGCSSESGESKPPTANIGSSNGDSGSGSSESAKLDGPVELRASAGGASPARPRRNLTPEVVISTSAGDIRVRLDAAKAPRTVGNFLRNYVDRDFYDGTIFHYVEKGSMVIAGGYTKDLTPKETAAPILNEADNGLKNRRGTIAMARHPDYPKSATSQFFINVADNPQLDWTGKSEKTTSQASLEAGGEAQLVYDTTIQEVDGYCVFGEVVEGMEVAEKIAATPVSTSGDFPNVPTEPIVIKSVRRVE